MDKVKDKAHDAKEKIKDKTTELKDKASAKMHRAGKADVSATQQALKDKGFDPGPVDGRMGPRTKTALLDFQRKEGLKPTGRLDNDTVARLGVSTAKAKTDTVTPAASPSTMTPSAPAAQNNAGTTQPPATPEDKTTPPTKINTP